MPKPFILFFLSLASLPLCAESPDSAISSFELQEKKYVETMSFPGEYANLEKIDIDGRRKYRAELELSGSYPKLASIRYQASLGKLTANLKGAFPELAEIEFSSGSGEMLIDLSGHFDKECHIQISSKAGDVEILLPKEIGITLETERGYKGKIVVPESLIKTKGGWLKKNFRTAHEKSALLISASTQSGTLVFKEKK